MADHEVVELLGDGISAELSTCVHAIADALPVGLRFRQVDLSLEARRARGTAVYDDAVAALRELRTALKYPTVTEAESPNKVLRERSDFAVIHRHVATIEGVENNFKGRIDVDIVRIATGGTYEDRGRRIGQESAVSLRVIERTPCRHAARFAFELATRRKSGVVSTSKYTIQRAADGLFEDTVEELAQGYPDVPYRRELFDALLAGLILHPDRYAVIVCPNEYGDFLSDMACGLIGSIGLGDSASYAFDEEGRITLALFDPAGGTAPDIAGRGICNPTAALLALASMLAHLGEERASSALRGAIGAAIRDGEKTADIGGTLGTSAFTAAVARRAGAALAGR